MSGFKRFLLYETNSNGGFVDYGEIVAIINSKLVNVNPGGEKDSSGNLLVLEAVAVEGNYVPKIGDWVSIEWRNGSPVAIGGENSSTNTGLTNINNDVKIVSQTDMASGVINGDHIRANEIEALHITAQAIQAQHISANAINTINISANAVTGDKIAAGSITASNISANTITGDKMVAGTISGNLITAGTISGNLIAANSISGNQIVANSIDAGKLTISARTQGLLGQYFTNTGGANKFETFKGSDVSTVLVTDWTTGAPSIMGQSDNYAIRYQGLIFTAEAGNHTFFVTANEGAKIWVNNVLVIDAWTGSSGVERTGTITLAANTWYTFRIDYYELVGNASIDVKWQTPSMGAKGVIPAMYLTQSQTTIDGGTILTQTIDAGAIKVGTITAASGVIADAAIQTAHIASGSITSAKIGVAEIKSGNIADANITNAKIANLAVDNAKIANIDAGKITTGYLAAGRIEAETITGDMILAHTISGNHIVAGSIDTAQLHANSVTASKILGGTITGDKIAADTIDSHNIIAGSITSEHIATQGLDANIVNVYNPLTGQVLIGGGYLRVDGLDVGVVQSDNLVGNGLFLTASSAYGLKRSNENGEAILGNVSNLPGAHQIWKYSTATGAKVGELGSSSSVDMKKPVDFAIDLTGTYGYVSIQGDNKFAQVLLDNAFEFTGKSLNMGTGPSEVVFTGDTLGDMKHFFVLNNDPSDNKVPDSLIVIDAPPASVNDALYVHHWIELGNTPYDMVLEPGTKQLYVTQAGQGDIAIIDMSDHNSTHWKVKGTIPISAYMTDNYHGGLEGFFGLDIAVGGDTSAAYDSNGKGASTVSDEHSGHVHSGYGSPAGSLKQYEPRGIALSSDPDTLYVCDFKNNELVVIDKHGNAPYNDMTGQHTAGNMGSFGEGLGMPMGDGGGDMDMGDMDMSGMDNATAMLMEGGGPGTWFVRYRIPIGNSPDYVTVANGKVFVSLQGSASIAVITEQDILDEIAADKAWYTPAYKYDPFLPLRDLPVFDVRTIAVGSKPAKMIQQGTLLYTVVAGQNQIKKIDIATETVLTTINTGPNPKGLTFSLDGQFFYVVNHGGSGDLSFVYPKGAYIGDAFLGLEGGINLQGAEFWIPDRSDWIFDSTSGDVESYSVIEFRINEPFLNEGGYTKMALIGKHYQYALIEQDIYTVTNYSNGNSSIVVTDETLIPNDLTTFTSYSPRGEWINTFSWMGGIPPQEIEIKPTFKVFSPISGGGYTSQLATQDKYTITYGDKPKVVFSGGVVPSGGFVTSNYTARQNAYWKPQNGSIIVAKENGSSENFSTYFEIDEFVPKFVVLDNQQTEPFMPVADGIHETYTGLEYSIITNRAAGKTVTASAAPTSGSLSLITDDVQIYEAHGDHADMDMFPDQPFVTLPAGLQYVTIDLGKVYMIGQVTVSHVYEDYSRKYHNTKTQVSQDGITWTTVYDSAVSGEYDEHAVYHPVHGHTHYAKVIAFNAKPVRYVRDYANGWTSVDGSTSGTTNQWTEIKVFGDWEVETGYVYPAGSDFAGQQMATNGRCVVTTDIQDAYIAYDMQIEFTAWWYMTYLVGPEFGRLKVDMSSMAGSHFLSLDAPYNNKIAHRHIMPFTPSNSITANATTGVKDGKHRATIRQVSGKISLDRIRVEDFQILKDQDGVPESNRVDLSTQTVSSYKRQGTVAQKAKWYQGVGKQSTEGAYDTPRKNQETGLPDLSVPIKYRFRVKAELEPVGAIQERGIVYVTSAIFETGKQHTHWRRSESIDSFPANKIQQWDANQPHNTGIQHAHLANGSVMGAKILPHAIMDYHISPYARIEEFKLNLKHPTHDHGVWIMGAGPMGMPMPFFHSNKDFLDGLTGFAGISGNFGSGSTISRSDHVHDNLYFKLVGGTITGNVNITGNVAISGTLSVGTITSPTLTTITGNIAVVSANVAGLSGNVATNYYTKTAVDGLLATSGDIRAASANTFLNTNTFTNAGLAVKIKPSSNVIGSTTIFTIDAFSGNTLFSVKHGGDVTIPGNLYVSGSTISNGSQTITGNYDITGNMGVSGNVTLGDASTDTVTVNGQVILMGAGTATGNAVRADRQIIAGTGLTGGGNLTADRTLAVSFGTTGTTVASGNHNHDTSYLKLNGAGTVSGGTLLINTNTAANPFTITRGGSLQESAQMYIDDANYYVTYTNDEASSQILFTLTNTDTETNGGVSANTGSIKFTQSNLAGTAMYVGTNMVWHGGNFVPANYMPITGGTFTNNVSLALSRNLTLISGNLNVTGGIFLNGQAISAVASGNYVKTDVTNQAVMTGFTVDNSMYIGTTTGNGGQLIIRSGNTARIQLDGNFNKATGVLAYIDASGNAQFSGNVAVKTLIVSDSGNVANLNASYIKDLPVEALVKHPSILELGGKGIHEGLNVTQTPSASAQVIVSGGTVYTNSGMRVALPTQNIAFTTPAPAANSRYDILIVKGSSAGANEGTLDWVTGSASASPVEPTIPTDAIRVARILVPALVGSILDSQITLQKEMRRVGFDVTGNTFMTRVPVSIEDKITSTLATVAINKPIKGTAWATSLTVASGSAAVTWTHNLGLGTNYAIALSSNSPNRHVYWSSKATNSIIINLDDATDVAVIVDAVITAY